MMFEETYRRINRRVSPDPAMVAGVREMARAADRPRARRVHWRRGAAAAAALILCLTLALPALAGNVPAAYDLLYAVSPGAAQFFMPVRASCEAGGTRMEVVSARVEGDTAELFVSLRDLEGDRVDETTDLFDSYSIRRGFDAAATCSLYGWDPETRTVTFLVSVTRMDGKPITGEKLTFSVREFISRKTELLDAPVEARPGDADASPATRTVFPTGLSGSAAQERPDSRRTYTVLEPGAALAEPAEGVAVTAMGWVDGKLHIQLGTADKLTLDSHGFVYLTDGDGNRLDSDFSVSFREETGEARMDYQEFVFDVSPEQAGEYSLYGSFWTAGLRAEGPWQVTFPMPEGGE